jgi:hypothetical protein
VTPAVSGLRYLRVFLEGDAHDVIFSPNTQPPDADTAEGPFHTWVAASGVWSSTSAADQRRESRPVCTSPF